MTATTAGEYVWNDPYMIIVEMENFIQIKGLLFEGVLLAPLYFTPEGWIRKDFQYRNDEKKVWKTLAAGLEFEQLALHVSCSVVAYHAWECWNYIIAYM